MRRGEHGENWYDLLHANGEPLRRPERDPLHQAGARTGQVRERAGLPALTFHELRHSCASLLAAQGVPAHEIARLLGHSDVRLTLNTYTHAFDAGRRRVADKTDGIGGEIRPGTGD